MTSSGQQIITTHKYPGPILESKGMDMIFQKKSNKILKKDKTKYWKIWAKMYKI